MPFIYASQVTYDDIRTDGQGFIKVRKELHGNDFPSQKAIPLPNQVVRDGMQIRLGGLLFQVIQLPQNETLATTLYYLPEQRVLFAGDVVVNKHIPFLIDGNSANWLTQLRTMLNQYPNQQLYPGHGEPGLARSLIETQIGYIGTFRKLVAAALEQDNQVTPQEKAGIAAALKQQYSNYQTSLLLPGIVERNIDGVAQELKTVSIDSRSQLNQSHR